MVSWKRIVFIQIRTHGFAVLNHARMIPRSRYRRQHEEGSLLDSQFILQPPDIFLDGLGRVEGEAENIGDVGRNFRIVPGGYQIPVILHLVLHFAGGLQVLRD